MRLFCLTSLVLLNTTGLLAKTVKEEKTFPVASIKSIKVDNRFGKVDVVVGKKHDTIQFEIKKEKFTDKCKIKENVGKEMLTYMIEGPDTKNCVVQLILTTPQKMDLSIDTEAGSIKIIDIHGKIRAISGTGDLSFKGVSPEIFLISTKGKIDAKGSFQTAEFRSGSSEINVIYTEVLKNSTLTLKTASGNMTVQAPSKFKINTEFETLKGKVTDAFKNATDYDLKIIGDSASGNFKVKKSN